jgi:hypothetical protein
MISSLLTISSGLKSRINLILRKSSFIISVISEAIKAQSVIILRPSVGLIKASCSTTKARKNPRAYADINKKPVLTVSSSGKVSSLEKSIPTGITGTSSPAANIMLMDMSKTLPV